MANPRPPVHYEFPDMNPDDRLRELILYIADRCSSDPTFSATKLNKILFYSDFLSFGRYGKPITGCAYKALEKGPAPRGLNFVRDRMVDSDDIRIRKSPVYTHERHQIIPLRAPELVMFSARDIKVVDEMIELTLGELAKDVSEDSHWRAWWIARDRLTEGGSDLIPYEAVFISNDPLTNADIKRVRELNNRFHWEQATKRTLVEEPEYTEQLSKLGNIRALDIALRGVLNGIADSAERFDLVPGFDTIRVAKVWSLGLRIVFQISPSGNEVKLKWIERIDQPGIFDDEEEEF